MKKERGKDHEIRKSLLAEREEEILKFWKENRIFEKTLEKPSPRGEFVFYEGPPTANGRPGIHHLEARAFKDAIPRFKTMQGYHVRRKGGWDTHGLPVEIEVERELGLKSKKDIEKYGVAAFNKKCKENVWRYVDEWKHFTERIGFWLDLENPYITYESKYIESVWSIIKKIHDRGLLYKDYKVLPWCPRCGTALSSHELALGYKDIDDTSVYVKFKAKDNNEYYVAWTTTPWTLLGNVALAINPNLTYLKILRSYSDEEEQRKKYQSTILQLDRTSPPPVVNYKEEFIILEKNSFERLKRANERKPKQDKFKVVEEFNGDLLLGREYEPPFAFLQHHISDTEKEKIPNAFKIYDGHKFVTSEYGTGIVHTAVMYGQDDFELGTKENLPKYHLVDERGIFKKETGPYFDRFVHDKKTNQKIVAELVSKGLWFTEESLLHSYPFCWRCGTKLIYYARNSWYVRMSKLRDELIRENEKINWEPEHIKRGRFGEWLSEVKDWAISRERYWGTPLPIWVSEGGEKIVVDSISELKKYSKKSGNKYFLIRHAESEKNTAKVINADLKNVFHLTSRGKEEAKRVALGLMPKKIDLIFSSPFNRCTESAEIIKQELGIGDDLLVDDRLWELKSGKEYEGKPDGSNLAFFENQSDRFFKSPEGGETFVELNRRVGEFIYELDKIYSGKNILIVTHAAPISFMKALARGFDREGLLKIRKEEESHFGYTQYVELDFAPLPHDENFEIDLHKPYIDEVVLEKDGEEYRRVPEVMDVWLDSGSMPFAQDHYPFENREWVERRGYPADYISEAIDQTRGWFYTLHAVGTLMDKGLAFKNVICLGHILDAEGRKMSKSIGNVIDPKIMISRYGADPLRFWMYSVNQPGDSKNFDERTVDEMVKKVFNLYLNSVRFYELYADKSAKTPSHKHLLDRWILSLLNKLILEVTDSINSYKLFEASRSVRKFVADLSQWYVRRSRERFRREPEGIREASGTLRFVLLTLAEVLAPFIPFTAEDVYLRVEGESESVHLSEWPEAGKVEKDVLERMEETRRVASLALEARAKVGIKVRQPLLKLTIKDKALKGKEEYLEIIKEEVNVKSVKFDSGLTEELSLETTITEELKREGNLKELVRALQEARKEKKLKPGELVPGVIKVVSSSRSLVEASVDEIKRVASLSEVKIDDLNGENNDQWFKITLG